MSYKEVESSKMTNNLEELEEYKKQLENGICEMMAKIEQLREEIHDLLEKKEALEKVINVYKKDLRVLT